jgi:hypothetical protein
MSKTRLITSQQQSDQALNHGARLWLRSQPKAACMDQRRTDLGS